MAGPITKTKSSFIRRQIISDEKITDEQILENWNAHCPKTPLAIRTIRKERTELKKTLEYDRKQGLIDFYSSQVDLLIAQYQNIEQLLGPAGTDWTWSGEHCEALLRNAIQQTLPTSFQIGKGYIYGHRNTCEGPLRSPEIDILIYDTSQFAPIFSIGQFVIVRAESVRAAIQVKRTLDANTLSKAVENVVSAKRHVFENCQFNSSVIVETMYTAIVGFEDKIQKSTEIDAAKLSDSYQTALQPYISEFSDGYFLPDFIGSMTGAFLHFPGINMNEMLYQAFRSTDGEKSVALAFLLYMLIGKIRPFGFRMLPGFPPDLAPFGGLSLWKKTEEEAPHDPDT